MPIFKKSNSSNDGVFGMKLEHEDSVTAVTGLALETLF